MLKANKLFLLIVSWVFFSVLKQRVPHHQTGDPLEVVVNLDVVDGRGAKGAAARATLVVIKNLCIDHAPYCSPNTVSDRCAANQQGQCSDGSRCDRPRYQTQQRPNSPAVKNPSDRTNYSSHPATSIQRADANRLAVRAL